MGKEKGRYIQSSPEKYRKIQIDTHRRKHKKVWIDKGEYKLIRRFVTSKGLTIKAGVCHGVRTGSEVHNFREVFDADIIGTEIAPTNIPHVIEWDFHEVKPEWLGKLQFIYSNSWDHSHDFELCLKQWMSCIDDNGYCFLTWSNAHSRPMNAADCFGIPFNNLVNLVNEKYKVEEVLRIPGRAVLAITHKDSE